MQDNDSLNLHSQHIQALPNLQRTFDTSGIDDRKGFWIKNKRDTERNFCDIRYWENPPVEWSSKCPDLSVADALLGWFRYLPFLCSSFLYLVLNSFFSLSFRYWGLEHKYITTKMSIRLGGAVPRQADFVNPPQHRGRGPKVNPKGVIWPYSLDKLGVSLTQKRPI